MCNNQIKFGVFFDKIMSEMDDDYMATGHYARLRREIRNSKSEIQNNTETQNSKNQTRVTLLKGVDENKDQSYFLYRVGEDRLAKAMFPVGGYAKPQVRDMARAYKLPNADKKDSQGICFIGKVDVRDFLRQYIPVQTGAIVTTGGKTIGQHEGVQFYTIGQRKGIGIGGGIPYYVVDKQLPTNTLVVGTEYDELLARSMLAIEDVHWINEAPRMGKTYTASIRYRQKPQAVTLEAIEGDEARFILTFQDPQRAVTDGQSAVLYDGDEVLGGGVIAA
jgi:tRNA-specific 2-thiouridylase